jgi:hypothetical protein
MDVCVCVCFFLWSGITLERLERFQPNLVRLLPYVYVRTLCMFYIYLFIYLLSNQFPKGIWMIHVVEEIKVLLLLGNRMVMTRHPRKHIVSAKM